MFKHKPCLTNFQRWTAKWWSRCVYQHIKLIYEVRIEISKKQQSQVIIAQFTYLLQRCSIEASRAIRWHQQARIWCLLPSIPITESTTGIKLRFRGTTTSRKLLEWKRVLRMANFFIWMRHLWTASILITLCGLDWVEHHPRRLFSGVWPTCSHVNARCSGNLSRVNHCRDNDWTLE